MHEKKNQTLAHTSVIPGMGQVKDPFEQAVRNVQNPGKEYYEQHMIEPSIFRKSMLACLYLMKRMIFVR